MKIYSKIRFLAARKRNLESNIDFCFPFSQESGWPLGTRILKTVFVFVVKQKRENKIFSKIRLRALHENGNWDSDIIFRFLFLPGTLSRRRISNSVFVFVKQPLALGYTHFKICFRSCCQTKA